LLLHGQVLDGSMFAALAARLARRWRVLVPDLPGYGGTPLLVPYSFTGVRQALEDELEARSIHATAAVGYSLGGYHALALALAGRVSVTRLALLAPLGGADPPLRQVSRDLAQAVRAGLRPGSAFAELAMPPELAAAHPGLAAEVATKGNSVPAATYVAEFEALAELTDLRPRLGEIRAPTLVRAGDRDRNVPLERVREVAEAIPGATLEVVPGCGHLCLQQDETATIESVSRFLGA
jgi:3-oxoadipate enol-lactonase